jgi:hypothetical protein
MDTCRGPGVPSVVCSYMKLSCMVDLTCVALRFDLLTFDDNNKQKQYETISFNSIQSEVEEIKR